MFIVYAPIPNDELRKLAEETIPRVSAWFESNPKRRVCTAELWYGKRLKLKRKTFAEQINAYLSESLK